MEFFLKLTTLLIKIYFDRLTQWDFFYAGIQKIIEVICVISPTSAINDYQFLKPMYLSNNGLY